MRPPTGFDAVTADSYRWLCRSPAWLVFPVVVIRQPVGNVHKHVGRTTSGLIPAIAADCCLLGRRNSAARRTPEVSDACPSPPFVAPLGCCGRGRAIPLCPGSRSDINLFSYCESVVYLNAEIAHRAFNLLVPQQKLHGPQVASAAVDEGRLGSAQ